MKQEREAKNMTVGMLLATILLVLTFSGVLCGAWERLGIRQKRAAGWLLAMLLTLLLPAVSLGAWRGNLAGLLVTLAASCKLAGSIRPTRERVRVLLGGVMAGASGTLLLLLSDGQTDAIWAGAILIGALSCFLGVSRRGMLLCSLTGVLVAQGVSGVAGVFRTAEQPWTDAALLSACVSTALAEGIRCAAIALLTPPGVKGGHRG